MQRLNHYQGDGERTTACGLVGASLKTADTGKVNCFNCTKTLHYRLANRGSACGSIKQGEYNVLRCCAVKGHAGEHVYVSID
jgi:hypothetical protein